MASISGFGSAVGQLCTSLESGASISTYPVKTISPIGVLIEQDLGADLRESESMGLRHIAKLLDCNNMDFPFMDNDLLTLKNLKNRTSLIAKEFYLNYGRFALGAACGFSAVLLCYTSPKITPLLSGLGAGISGSFGICVTKIRAINLQ